MAEPCLTIAHRGARSLAPENTLAAARRGLETGAEMWELDVAMSADGVLYLLHDDTLTRTSNVAEQFPARAPWESHALTWEEIRSLDFGSWFNRDDPFGQIAAGALSDAEQASFVGEQAPSLEEALRFTRDAGWRVNIELKDLRGTPGDATIAERTVALVQAMAMEEQVLLSSFNHEYLRRVRAASPAIATAALVVVPAAEPLALVRALDAQAYNPGVFAIRPDQIPPLRDAGIDVFVWTVNEESVMRELIAHRASGLFTDFPQRMRPIVGGTNEDIGNLRSPNP